MNDFQKVFDFMSRNHEGGVDIPKTAGPPTWRYLHTLAKLTPPDSSSQDQAFETVKQVVATFPCKNCAEHGMGYISSHPFEGNIEEYLCDFHNAVNKRTGKPKHSCEVNLLSQPTLEVTTRDLVTETNKAGEEDVIVESVPYYGGTVGISLPLFPGGPDINFDVGTDWPFTTLPLPKRVIRRLSNPPIEVPQPGESDKSEQSETQDEIPRTPVMPRLPTLKEIFEAQRERMKGG